MNLSIALRCAAALLATLMVVDSPAADTASPDASADPRLVFPRDHGAHPDDRTEWWYVTGWLRTSDGEELGFQVTFFRSRIAGNDANPSRFAARQLLFAHAALADPKVGRLLHDERIARSGFGAAEASASDAAVVLDGWRFERAVPANERPSGEPPLDGLRFRTSVTGERFALDLDLAARGPLLAEGADAARPGYSQKGPSPHDASRYYSVPQLAASGFVTRDHRRVAVTGSAWLDREWSNAYLDPRASGWDWVGLNFDDGGALMAFRMRDRSGARLWAGGTRRHADGRIERFQPDDVAFTTRRAWTSPRTKVAWPVAQTITVGGPTPATIDVEPMMDDQELDSRLSTGTIYWEGAVRARDARGVPLGRGYLEMTGYFEPIRF